MTDRRTMGERAAVMMVLQHLIGRLPQAEALGMLEDFRARIRSTEHRHPELAAHTLTALEALFILQTSD